MIEKALILAGGESKRLGGINKALTLVYDTRSIYFSLKLAYDAGIRDIGIVCNIHNQSEMEITLGYTFHDAVISYWPQDAAYMMFCNKVPHEEINATAKHTNIKGQVGGILAAEKFIGDDPVLVLFADNIIIDNSLPNKIKANANTDGNVVFSYYKRITSDCGTMLFNADGKITALYEKAFPQKTTNVISGVHIFGKNLFKLAKQVNLSPRGELELTDLNKLYLKHNKLYYGGKISEVHDVGTPRGLLNASQAIGNIRFLEESKEKLT